MKIYADKLRDPRWQKKRLEVMQLDNFTCRHCQTKTQTLNVHHINYERGKAPWEYEASALITLCEPCHRSSEDAIYALRRFLAWGHRDHVEELRQHFNALQAKRREEVINNA
jgi:5-methylcytosine-specific restriction endonuclease McrA